VLLLKWHLRPQARNECVGKVAKINPELKKRCQISFASLANADMVGHRVFLEAAG